MLYHFSESSVPKIACVAGGIHKQVSSGDKGKATSKIPACLTSHAFWLIQLNRLTREQTEIWNLRSTSWSRLPSITSSSFFQHLSSNSWLGCGLPRWSWSLSRNSMTCDSTEINPWIAWRSPITQRILHQKVHNSMVSNTSTTIANTALWKMVFDLNPFSKGFSSTFSAEYKTNLCKSLTMDSTLSLLRFKAMQPIDYLQFGPQ